MDCSTLQKNRYDYVPKTPALLKGHLGDLAPVKGEETEAFSNRTVIKQTFPRTYGKPLVTFAPGSSDLGKDPGNIGVVLSGGQAPGGHNVIAGLYDSLKKAEGESKLYGFLGGPAGILGEKVIELTEKYVDQYRNTGGFDIIGSGRTKIETEEQFQRCLEVCKKLNISSLVIIGGDDSNTNAALLAEFLETRNAGITVVGVPKTIDGDMRNEDIEMSFGFDTATKVYAELIGNICRDAASARKYWHFIKLMGRSASHICLECALQTRPNIALISEEVEAENWSLNDIVRSIVNTVIQRSENGENFGIVLVPEGLIEYIPEMKALISELNNLLAEHAVYYNTLRSFEDQTEWVNKNLSRDTSYTFSSLPTDIQRQLLMDRDPHGNVQVSRIETENLLIDMVTSKLLELKTEGKFSGAFATQHHFFGYEGRSAFPSNFDADYGYCLGCTAYLLSAGTFNGYTCMIKNLAGSREEWVPGGVPIVSMMNLERRKGKVKPVIRKAMVDLNKKPFKFYAKQRSQWAVTTSYLSPGAIQYFGPPEVCDLPGETMQLEYEERKAAP
ncbi:MAG: diphosphate--fructose-6-phosphate 1-phosphotransferase [Spirochaetales bacterium]|nr:diphosphate--fructose-6-phosphate 1-phosphotransferase [Spirochaetales bacterium]